ncbi:MAG: hypothetical protein AAGA05_15120 [Pseudomonadota bacterium]
METDLALVLGIVIAGFSLPSILSALGDGRTPRASAVTVLIAGGLILYAVQQKPGGYAWSDVPNAFIRVAAQILP